LLLYLKFKKFGIQHIVIGHTVTPSQVIQLKADGGVIMIGVGMSKTNNPNKPEGGPAMCLLIENGKFYAVTSEEKKELPMKLKVSENDMLQRYLAMNVRLPLVEA
jgi:hypothetical protein